MTKQILLSLLNCSWQWALLGVLTWLISRRFCRANSTNHGLWLMFLLSLPILFVLNQFVPAISFGNPAPELTQAQPIHIAALAPQTVDLPEFTSIESSPPSQRHPVNENKFAFSWTTTNLILCIWAIGTLVMLIRVAFGLFRIHRLHRRATVADDAYQAVCKRLAQKLNINRPVTVSFSDQVVSPISFGWLSPSILIPPKLNLEQFELVAAHELAHVQRLDWLINLFSHLVGAIFFFHPIYHFLNRKLVNLREQICDDWVIQLTGARKNYAQCLIDLVAAHSPGVRKENQTIPLALALNQPSQLESRIDAILKHNRRLDLKPKPHLFMLATFLLSAFLPVLSMAQLMPLRTVQVSLFAQTPQEPKVTVDKKDDKKKKQAEMKKKKEYKEGKPLEVLDPAGYNRSEENPVFSGPQPNEKLPPLKVTNIGGENDGKTFDITANADGKALVLFLQDTNAVGIKGLANMFRLILKIDHFQKEHSKTMDAEKSNQGIQVGVVFLTDDLESLPEWAYNMLRTEIQNEVLKGLSPYGREGPGVYGLNRNVAQTVIIAKDGKVLHNFAFTQPMLYPNPYLLGAIAQALDVAPATLQKWLNEAAKKMEMEDLDKDTIATKFHKIQNAVKDGKISREEAMEWVEKMGITWKEDEALLKKEKLPTVRVGEDAKTMDRKRQPEKRSKVEVKNPDDFSKAEGTRIFSGPQPGEKLPPLMAKGINGETKGKTYDVIAKADGQLLVLFLQDESGLGLRGLVGVSRLLAQIAEKSKQKMLISAVFLGDAPDPLENQVSRLVSHIPNGVLLSISPDGREGPGSYGLNRSVAQTVIIAKDGKVLHNFAFTQPMLRPDPHVLGAIAQAIGVQPAMLEKWLNVKNSVIQIKNPAEGEKTGKMLLNGKFVLDGNVVHLDGTVVKFDELLTFLRNLPEGQKQLFIIQSERDVPHDQVVKVMDVAKEAGIEKIAFAIDGAEGKSPMLNKERILGFRFIDKLIDVLEPMLNKEQMQANGDSEKADALKKQLAEMVEKGEITFEEALERYKEAFSHPKED